MAGPQQTHRQRRPKSGPTRTRPRLYLPGCTVPGYGCQVHHATTDWAEGGTTDIDHLDLACGPHNRLVKRGGWTTRKRRDGTTEWIPPPGKPLRGGTNAYHHRRSGCSIGISQSVTGETEPVGRSQRS